VRLSDFDYHLPRELIAQHPIEKRDRSRLLVLNKTGKIEHRYFYEITSYLNPGDVLVLNDTKVIPTKLLGKNPKTKREVEFLLFDSPRDYARLPGKTRNKAIWEALAKPAKQAKKGSRWQFPQGVWAEVAEVLSGGSRLLHFEFEGDFFELLEKIGHTPLPPYIRRDAEKSDEGRYQTVYAHSPGACAAPTAGLHFTRRLLDEIHSRGVKITRITLHVGPGTFLPVRSEVVEDHQMWPEYYEINQEAAETIKKARGRVIVVGTTTVRALETGPTEPTSGWTDLFIYPGFKFRVVDALITNFHLPKSTLLMLVAAFVGWERVLTAYQEAIQKRYRFYSYGDAMFIL